MHPSNTDSQGWLLWRIAITMTILPTLAILFRFWSRIILPADTKLWWDDWLALLAWAASIGSSAIVLRGVQLGLGKHFEDFKSIGDITELAKLLWASQYVFDFGITFAKLSALLFYRRLFSASKSFRITHGLTFGLVIVYIVYKFPLELVSCIPTRKNWEPDLPGHCLEDSTAFVLLLVGLIQDVITDLIILLLPIPILNGLEIPRKKKFTFVGAFVLGYVTLITSLGRTGSFISIRPHLTDPDVAYYQVPVLVWSLTEISVSVVSICIPSCFTLGIRLKQGGLSSLFTSCDLSVTSVNAPRRHLRENRRINTEIPLNLSQNSGLPIAQASEARLSNDTDDKEIAKHVTHREWV
ncbi:hypothetical protein F4808DRAFT_431900 [Astrocystis sublimbata]|nr:hypothetical protein F4808DRAFT_431900 [Astrocystis sublimbata]